MLLKKIKNNENKISVDVINEVDNIKKVELGSSDDLYASIKKIFDEDGNKDNPLDFMISRLIQKQKENDDKMIKVLDDVSLELYESNKSMIDDLKKEKVSFYEDLEKMKKSFLTNVNVNIDKSINKNKNYINKILSLLVFILICFNVYNVYDDYKNNEIKGFISYFNKNYKKDFNNIYKEYKQNERN